MFKDIIFAELRGHAKINFNANIHKDFMIRLWMVCVLNPNSTEDSKAQTVLS